MGLTKRTYTDNVTVITAENLNDIQDAIIALEETPAQGLTEDMKQALLQLAQKVAYIDDQGQTYYDDLYDAFYPPKTVVLITAVFNQGSTVIYDDTALDDLKQYLTVTAKYDDNTTAILADSAYTLSGLLEAGTSTVTVAYNGLTTTFTVNVTARPTLSSISAVYTQSGTVYDTDTLDSLKDDLVVTAVYSDSSTQTVPAADYTLSGTLTAGTSTITVSYGGKTTTFSVTVTAQILPSGYQQVEWIGNTSRAWIQPTNHRLPSAFRIEAKAKIDDYNTGATYGNIAAVFQPGATTYGMELAYKKEDSTIIMFLGAQSVVTPSDINDILIMGAVCDGSKTKAYLLVNGERVYGTEQPATRNYTGNDWGIFFAGTSANSYNQFVGRIYWLRLYDSNDDLLEEWIPCYRKSDNVIGMYETVGDVFYTNNGTTSFTKGGDV